jgi:serine/threonine-protein phosphatase 2B catalytic subunit
MRMPLRCRQPRPWRMPPSAGKSSEIRLWPLAACRGSLHCCGPCLSFAGKSAYLTKTSSASVSFREESERVSELKGVSGSAKLPYGALATGAEGIQTAITSFNDACVAFPPTPFMLFVDILHRRKSDIENERLPPELIDPESEEAKPFRSNPATPSSGAQTPAAFDGIDEKVASGPFSAKPGSVSTSSPATDTLGSSAAGSPTGGVFRRGHARQQSLGTTKTSPSTRRRSVESTISLIREAAEGESDEGGNDKSLEG